MSLEGSISGDWYANRHPVRDHITDYRVVCNVALPLKGHQKRRKQNTIPVSKTAPDKGTDITYQWQQCFP